LNPIAQSDLDPTISVFRDKEEGIRNEGEEREALSHIHSVGEEVRATARV
jgi:hypothetical protein